MDTSLVSWIKNTPRPFVIAGPCSIETEERTHQVISDLKSEGKTQLLRAGIWKPRTRPDSFEGIGEVGLPWLSEAAKKHELPFSIEVAIMKHPMHGTPLVVPCSGAMSRTAKNQARST